MKGKNEILNEFFNSEILAKSILKIKEDARAELVQHVSLILLMKPEIEVQLAYYKETLLPFFMAICYRELNHTRSRYNSMYKDRRMVYADEPIELIQEVQDNEQEDFKPSSIQLEKAMLKLSIYERDIILAYSKLGSFGLVAAAYSIPKSTVVNDINRAKNKIYEYCNFKPKRKTNVKRVAR